MNSALMIPVALDEQEGLSEEWAGPDQETRELRRRRKQRDEETDGHS